MNAVDRELDERARRADAPLEYHDNSVENAPRGAQVIQNNQLSTPVLVTLILCAVLSAAALGLAINARDSAQLAEREARLAQKDQANNQIQIEALKLVASQEKRP